MPSILKSVKERQTDWEELSTRDQAVRRSSQEEQDAHQHQSVLQMKAVAELGQGASRCTPKSKTNETKVKLN